MSLQEFVQKYAAEEAARAARQAAALRAVCPQEVTAVAAVPLRRAAAGLLLGRYATESEVSRTRLASEARLSRAA